MKINVYPEVPKVDPCNQLEFKDGVKTTPVIKWTCVLFGGSKYMVAVTRSGSIYLTRFSCTEFDMKTRKVDRKIAQVFSNQVVVYKSLKNNLLIGDIMTSPVIASTNFGSSSVLHVTTSYNVYVTNPPTCMC